MNFIILIAIILFILMLLAPLLLSMLTLKGKGNLLKISQKKSRNPRYFGLSFASLMEKALEHYDGSGEIQLSKRESLIFSDTVAAYPADCESLVYAKDKDFRPSGGITFHKEIYACQDVYLDGVLSLRAVYGKKDIMIGEATEIIRWVDAEGTVSIHDYCNLGMSATSARRIVLGRDCTFRRLFAPSIYLGWDFGQGDAPVDTAAALSSEIPVNQKIVRNLTYVDDDATDDRGILDATIVTKFELTVLEGFIVHGHIRSHKSVIICDSAVVYGNIFAEGDIHIGENAVVYGNVFTHSDFSAERGAQIGQYGEIKSLIAHGIISFGADCRVYGYVSSETEGKCCPDYDMEYMDPEEQKTFIAQNKVSLRKSSVLPETKNAVFATAAEFNQMSSQVFRKNKYLEQVEIPEGVTEIRPSFFYSCTNLYRASLPSTLEKIGAFSFFQCQSLKQIDLSHCENLTSIEASAFEGCYSLEEVILPASLLTLHEAAFAHCKSLVRVTFAPGSKLSTLTSHVFLECHNLANISLPENLCQIGMSTFYGCSSLLNLIVPSSVSYIGRSAFAHCPALQELQILSKALEPTPDILKDVDPKVHVTVATDTIREILYPEKGAPKCAE